MANFSRSDLQFTYSWTTTEGDSKKVTGYPDDVLLNRHEGYEVLYFLNKYMDHRKVTSIGYFHRFEKAIHDSLPSNIRSHANVRDWLDKNA